MEHQTNVKRRSDMQLASLVHSGGIKKRNAQGMVKKKVAPLPGSDSTQMRPP